jgi:hypothetical protein
MKKEIKFECVLIIDVYTGLILQIGLGAL